MGSLLIFLFILKTNNLKTTKSQGYKTNFIQQMEGTTNQQAPSNKQERLRVGMVSHSLLSRYPLNQFSYFLNIVLQIHTASILTFSGKNDTLKKGETNQKLTL